jgi:hypothetical protein
MIERPILFSAPMVRALLDGSKTQTRRVVKPTPEWIGQSGVLSYRGRVGLPHALCPYGQPGDRLWVRETHMDLGACYLYRADAAAEQERAIVAPRQPWRPAIHMPRAASRITLEITGVRVERLQDISEDDALAEGCSSTAIVHEDGEDYTGHYASEEYQDLWESINGPGSWEANPWVWVVEFKRLDQKKGSQS